MEQRIVPGQRVDNWTLGMTEDEVRAAFDYKPKRHSINRNCLRYANIDFYFGMQRQLISIAVHSAYDGNYQGIGVGSTLADVQAPLGRPFYSAEGFCIRVEGVPAISFQLDSRKMNHLHELEAGDLEDLDHMKGFALKDLRIKRFYIHEVASVMS